MNYDYDSFVEIGEKRTYQDHMYDLIYDLNCDKTKQEIGWGLEILLDLGIEETINWIKENWQEIIKQPLEYSHKK